MAPRRTNIARTNLSLCFPDKSQTDINDIVKENAKLTGLGMLEAAMLWLGPSRDWDAIVEVEGAELLNAHSKEKGALLITFHHTSMEFVGCFLGLKVNNLGALYRPNSNDIVEACMVKGRSRYLQPISRNNTRALLKHIKKSGVAWYAPDQDYGRKQSVFVPFLLFLLPVSRAPESTLIS